MVIRFAEQTGIGRATLYKYFPDAEAILAAWHERHVAGHLEYLARVRDEARDPSDRLRAVFEAYADCPAFRHSNPRPAVRDSWHCRLGGVPRMDPGTH